MNEPNLNSLLNDCFNHLSPENQLTGRLPSAPGDDDPIFQKPGGSESVGVRGLHHAAKGHARPHVVAADLGQPEGVEKLVAAMQAAGLEPAILVNNAGAGLLGDAALLDRAQQLAIVDLNNRALTDLTLRCLPGVTRHKGGILNVASVAGFMPGPGMAVYHASKAFVVSFTEALHEELKVDGVKVCALCPGPVPTEFNEQAGVPHDYLPAALARPAEEVARAGYAGFIGGHRIVVPGKPNRIATLLPRLLPRGLMLAGMGWRWQKARRRG